VTIAQSSANTSSGWRFKLLGFDVSVPWNALIGVAIIGVLWYPEFAESTSALGQWALAAIFALLLMASILFHEFAHGLVARAFGYPVTGITLWAMGGFTTYSPTKKHGPAREALIAVAGPVATLAIALVAFIAARSAPPGTVHSVLAALAWANALVGFFNLLPGSPLDGGALVKSLVWGITKSEQKGQVAAGWVGRGLAVSLVLSPFLLAWSYGGQPSLILIVVAVMLGWLLWTGASASLRAAKSGASLRSLPALGLAKPLRFVTESATVAQVMPLLVNDQHVAVTDSLGEPIGVVTHSAAAAVPAEQRERVLALVVCARVGAAPTIAADSSAFDVLRTAQETSSRFVFLTAPGGRVLIDTDEVFVMDGP